MGKGLGTKVDAALLGVFDSCKDAETKDKLFLGIDLQVGQRRLSSYVNFGWESIFHW